MAKTAGESTLPEQINKGQEDPPQNFPYGHKRHTNDCVGGSVEPLVLFLFGGALYVRFLRLVSQAASQTAETPAGGQRQGHGHGHVADIDRQHERELC